METIVINFENMTCLGKMRTLEDALALQEISLPHTISSAVMPFDTSACFNGFTHLELRLLIKNTCGKNYPDYHLNQLQVIAVEMFTQMEFLDYDRYSLLKQQVWKSSYCKDHSLKYNYVKGATIPEITGDGVLFQTTNEPSNVEQLAKNWFNIRQQLQEKSLSQLADISPLTAEKPATATLPQEKVKRAPTVENSPKTGSVKETIWQVADSLWGKIGKPTDVKHVLAMRKEAMQILEDEHGIKKTSSSNELGKWQKSRIQ